MGLPDIILLSMLKNKKSISEIMEFCKKETDFCKNSEYKNKLGKMLFKVAGYKIDKDFDYFSLFQEIVKITMKYRMYDPDEKNKPLNQEKMQDNLLKITPYIRKALAANGSKEVYEYLLYNGVDLRKESTFGFNFGFEPKETRIMSSIILD